MKIACELCGKMVDLTRTVEHVGPITNNVQMTICQRCWHSEDEE